MELASFRRKNLQMLATLMATVTYAVGFNPPGGVWQDTAGHLPGDPVMRSTHHQRYLVFFYMNAAAFHLSLMVVVVTLVLAACPKKIGARFDLALLLLMVMATVPFMAAYGTGACRDKFGVVVFSVMVATVVSSCLCQLWYLSQNSNKNYLSHDAKLNGIEKNNGNLIAPLSMFALTISYVAGLSTPGGFWDSAEGGHRPGATILHGKLLHLFFFFNTGQFVSSLHCVFLVMCGGVRVWLVAFSMLTGLLGLIVAYTVGTSRGRHATVVVICSLCAAILAYAIIHVVIRVCFCEPQGNDDISSDGTNDIREPEDVMEVIAQQQRRREASLVQLLAGLAVSNTYQAGMYPPGGVWQDGDKAGDPILQTTNPGRYRAFYYCNSAAFVASLLAIFLGQKRYLIKYHALQAAMILDLLSLIVAYAIGSCRDQNSSMYVLGIAAATVVYVVVHIQYFTLGSSADKDKDAAISEMVDKRGGRFLAFAILVASITYQAGLTPPGGFLLQDDIQSGHRAGDPVLLYNYPRRYKAFFYFNSVSFMVSTVLLLLLVNPNLYRPAIRSHALSLCSAVSFICLIGAFAAGSTQHLKTSFYFFVFAAVGFFLCLPILLTIYSYLPSYLPSRHTGDGERKKKKDDDPSRKKIYLMTLAILVGSATYQAGLDPPGGSWQSTSDAGHPVMRDHRRNRYLAFLCGNTISFVASIYLIELLLFSMAFEHSRRLKMAIGPTVVLQYLGFLVAYAAGSSRQWKTSWHVGALVIAVLAFVATHVMLSYCRMKTR